VGLAFRLAVGAGFLGALFLFGCAATPPPTAHLATNPSIAAPHARTSSSGADTEIDPDCPYLTVEVSTPGVGFDLKKSRALQEIQRPYMEKFSEHLERVGFKLWEPFPVRLERAGFKELGEWWAHIMVLGVTHISVF
jgi:hypothetical protein